MTFCEVVGAESEIYDLCHVWKVYEKMSEEVGRGDFGTVEVECVNVNGTENSGY